MLNMGGAELQALSESGSPLHYATIDDRHALWIPGGYTMFEHMQVKEALGIEVKLHFLQPELREASGGQLGHQGACETGQIHESTLRLVQIS